MIKWAVKYGNYFTVYNSESMACETAKGLFTQPIKVKEVEDAGGIDLFRILGKIGNLWFVRHDDE